ncbi:mitochondrial matrix iron-sulfur protein [Pestalotiopsis sp. 9143b]|nr:mitochondrial matrix iron-sulfur protein [Pestalotiopsis sp. 9143b]
MAPLRFMARSLRQMSNMVPSRLSQQAVARDSRLLLAQRRTFTTSPRRLHGHVHTPKAGEELYITFIDKENREHKIPVCKGDNLLDIAQAHDLEMEGACGGSCACSTCHVIVTDQDLYDKMPEPEDDENDMLDLAFGLTETSRLGCQVTMTKELDGLKVKLPSMTRNLQASDFSS